MRRPGERLLNGEALGSLAADGCPAERRSQEDRYLDTRDGALARAGYAARLRRQRSTTIVTVKSPSTAARGRCSVESRWRVRRTERLPRRLGPFRRPLV